MDNYFIYNEQSLASLGINLYGNERQFDKLRRVVVSFVVVASTFQSLMFLMTATVFDLSITRAFAMSLYELQGCSKYFAIVGNLNRLKIVKEKCEDLMSALSEKQIEENLKYFERCRRIPIFILWTSVGCVWLFNIMPLAAYFYFLMQQGIEVQMLPFGYWYPFNKTNYYFPVYFYEATCAHILAAVPLVMDGLVLLLTGQFTVLFKCHGENIAKWINEFNDEHRADTRAKLHRAVDHHNQLFDLTSELFEIYSIPLLYNVVSQSLTICFIAFMCSVRK